MARSGAQENLRILLMCTVHTVTTTGTAHRCHIYCSMRNAARPSGPAQNAKAKGPSVQDEIQPRRVIQFQSITAPTFEFRSYTLVATPTECSLYSIQDRIHAGIVGEMEG